MHFWWDWLLGSQDQNTERGRLTVTDQRATCAYVWTLIRLKHGLRVGDAHLGYRYIRDGSGLRWDDTARDLRTTGTRSKYDLDTIIVEHTCVSVFVST